MSTGSTDIIGMATQGGTGIAQIIAGALGTEEAQDKIQAWKKKYPNMDIPQSIVAATDLYGREAQRSQVAGYDLYKSQLEQSTAQGVAQSREAATSAADLLGATTSLYGQQSNALTQLEIEGARQQAQNKQMYGQQLNTLGSWQHQQYLMNDYQPWVSTMNELQGTLQSSYDMLTGGIGMLAGSGSGADFSNTNNSLTGTGTPTTSSATNYNVPQTLNYQGSTPLTTNQTMGQYQYNPTGQQTLGQYQYNPTGQQTLGQYIYG